jgi:nicotinamide-nucleotide amidase
MAGGARGHRTVGAVVVEAGCRAGRWEQDEQMDEQQADPDPAAAIAEMAEQFGIRVAVAESLTGGLISTRLAEAGGASRWYAGAVVAYGTDVKQAVLGVPEGPVVSEPAATAMALGARRLLRADAALSITGVGGPDSQDDQPPGTVWVCVVSSTRHDVRRWEIPGDGPADICHRATERALRYLRDELAAAIGAAGGS